MGSHVCRPDGYSSPELLTWREAMEGVREPVGTVRACPDCGRTWVVHLSTSPISAWTFRAWRRERRFERWRRDHRERRLARG